MSTSFLADNDLADLLVQLETRGLTAAEARELDVLLAAAPGADRDALAPAAAALTLAARLPSEPMPEALRVRLIAEGRVAVEQAATGKVVPLPVKVPPTRPA
jgi:hypothetical protein